MIKENRISIILFVCFFRVTGSKRYIWNFHISAGKLISLLFYKVMIKELFVRGDIPEDGKFTLTIPEEYKTYTGISQWLITNIKEEED